MCNDQHLNYTEIGNVLGKHRITISRDIKLGLIELETSYLPVWKYCAEVSQRRSKKDRKCINNYPRKILKFKTFEEYYQEEKVA